MKRFNSGAHNVYSTLFNRPSKTILLNFPKASNSRAIPIPKGQNAQLDAGLPQIEVGLGWNPRVDAGEDFDLDASCFMLAANGRIRSDGDVIFLQSTGIDARFG